MSKMRLRPWIGLVGAGVLAALIAGCGGSDGATGAQGPIGPQGPQGDPGPAGPAGGTQVTIASNATAPTEAATAAWAALAPQITVTGVTISSPPVVDFKVLDANGMPVIGLGNTSQSSTATVAGLANIGFTLAKLVPGGSGSTPSKWVSYLVTRPPTKAEVTLPSGQTDYTKLIGINASCNATATTAATWCGTYPTTDTQGTLVDHNDGTYTYTFYRDPKQAASVVASLTDSTDGFTKKADLGDLTYDATLTHRLGIQIGGNAPGTGSNIAPGSTYTPPAAVAMGNPANAVYDFRPDGGTVATARNVVTIDSCTECHAGKVLNHGSRKDPNYCATCHTDQVKYSFNGGEAPMLADGITFAVQTGTNAQVRPKQAILGGRAVGNLPNMIHKLHMGEHLVKQGYNYNNDDLGLFNERKFPQDLRNCTKCHDGSDTATHKTAQGNNWKTVPNRLACGACHDGIDFATGKGITLADKAKGVTDVANGSGHEGGPQANDSLCSLCHQPGFADIDISHLPVTPPNPAATLLGGSNANTNAAYIASGGSVNRLPAGAIKVTYDIKSVSRNASKQPVMVFRMLQDGTPVPFNDPATKTEMWDNFAGSPSAYFVFAVPQDGIDAPAEFNASTYGYLRNIWNGKATTNASGSTSAGTLTGPDATGYYTVTLTGVTVPDNAVMLTGGLGYSYSLSSTQPLIQTNLTDYPVAATTIASPPANQPNLTGGLIVIAPNAQKVATGYSGRRAIVEDARCNKCHQELGTFTEDAFHAGQRNDGTTCAWCHRPNQSSSGWSADSTYYIHAIHGAEKRGPNNPFTWHASVVGESFADILFPGVLSKCETCHLPGSYDFSSTVNALTSTGSTSAANSSANAVYNKLYRTVGQGRYALKEGDTTTNYSATCTASTSQPQSAPGAYAMSPYIKAASNDTSNISFGLGFTTNLNATTAATGCTPDGTPYSVAAGGATLQADSKTLVTSPITTACFACHVTTQAVAHMEDNGGSIYVPRSTALATTETCMVCHASGRVADIKAMHAK
jgi:OmcA/MtrC family decaheme c-type cytochrome